MDRRMSAYASKAVAIAPLIASRADGCFHCVDAGPLVSDKKYRTIRQAGDRSLANLRYGRLSFVGTLISRVELGLIRVADLLQNNVPIRAR